MNAPENPAAFPTPYHPNSHAGQGCSGMFLRDWIAGQALPGLMSLCANDTPRDGESVPQAMARKAYQVADAMLAERMKGQQP